MASHERKKKKKAKLLRDETRVDIWWSGERKLFSARRVSGYFAFPSFENQTSPHTQ